MTKYFIFLTINRTLSFLVLAATVLALICLSESVNADTVRKEDPAFLSVGLGYYDFNRKKETGTEFRAEFNNCDDFARIDKNL